MIGRHLIGASTGNPLGLSYDGLIEWKAGGITVDWSTVAAVSGSPAVVTPEGFTVPVGGKYLGIGQVMTQITTALTQTITVTGTPTGGSFTFNVMRPDTSQTGIITLPYNSALANSQTLFDAFFGAGNTVLSSASSAALPGAAITVTFAANLLKLVIPTFTMASNGLTGGTNSTAAFATSGGGTSGMYGPYDTAASDGRQTLTRGQCCILNEAVVKDGVLGLTVTNTDQINGLVGGRVWKARLKATSGTHSLANGPTYTELEAAFPRLMYASTTF